MPIGSKQEAGASPRDRGAREDPAVKTVASWVSQLARTLKTCRLYDSNNPTVVRFREELAVALQRLLEEQGALTLKFTPDDVRLGDHSLYPARSRDDNLAQPFYRDGIHAITFAPGIQAAEVEAVLDGILQVTGQNLGQDDLVTLLWEAHLDHVDVDYVPAEGDVGAGTEGPGEATETVPWPTGDAGEQSDETATAGAAEGESGATEGGRSDDWTTGELTVEIEAELSALETVAPTETQRYLEEHQAERQSSGLDGLLGVMRVSMGAETGPEDLDEFARFLPKVLRQAIGHGRWRQGAEAVVLLERCSSKEWAPEGFLQELLQPISVASAVEKLDQQEPEQIKEFVALAKALGDPALDWLNLVLGESQQRRTRRALAEAIAELCRDRPERLAPWLSDPRWYVVRNVVHILGWIGGNSIVGLLEAAARHPEPRVRHEVVAALGQAADPRAARRVLVKMLDGADTRLFCSILHQLSASKDPSISRLVMGYLSDVGFEERSTEEKRAIYSAVSATSGDEILAELEAELHKGGWFQRGNDLHRAAVARCIARIGTPAARALLEDGSRSKRGPLKKACDDALATWSSGD